MSEAKNGDRPELPEGWNWKALGEICEVRSGYGFPKDLQGRSSGDVPFAKVRDISAAWSGGERYLRTAAHYVSKDEAVTLRAVPFPAGTVVMAKIGEAVRLNRRAILAQPTLMDNNVMGWVPDSDAVLSEYLFFASLPLRLADISQATTLPSVRKSDVVRLSIPVPPLKEQRRIVLKISELWAEIERGEDLLTDAGRQLGELDTSLLEAACLGRELYRPVRSDFGDPSLSALPVGWQWVALAELAADEPRAITDGPFGSNLKSSHYTEAGPRVIRLQNIGEGVFLNAEAHISQDHFQTLRAHEALAGDIVLAALGEVLPRACVIPASLGPAIVKADCQRIRLRPEVNPFFVVACLNSRPLRDQAKSRTHGLGRTRLTLADARQLKLPFPPRNEQDTVVERLNGLQVSGASLRAARDDALAKADGLKRSLLRQAMSGHTA